MPSRAGSPNKNKQRLLAKLREEYPGYEPVIEIARAAHKLTAQAMEAEGSEETLLKLRAAELWKDAGTQHDKVAQYVTPKLKAIEVSGKDGEPIQHNLQVEFVGTDSKSVSAAVQPEEV